MSVAQDIRERIKRAIDEVSAAHRLSELGKRDGFVQSSMAHEQLTILDMLAGQLIQLDIIEQREAGEMPHCPRPEYVVHRCGVDGRVG